jgi:hypothetical protein
MQSHRLVLKVDLEQGRVLKSDEDVFIERPNGDNVREVADEGDGDEARLVQIGADRGVGYQTIGGEIILPVEGLEGTEG